MLNLGQVVYDYTNRRVIIFAGFEMSQDQETGKCHSESGFILKNGTFIHLKEGDKKPFKYTNLNMDDKPVIGSFVNKCQCKGCFFGIIGGNDSEVKVWAKEAIEEIETLINRQGLNVSEKEFGKRKYTCCNIISKER